MREIGLLNLAACLETHTHASLQGTPSQGACCKPKFKSGRGLIHRALSECSSSSTCGKSTRLRQHTYSHLTVWRSTLRSRE
jgi:hypothetical protein